MERSEKSSSITYGACRSFHADLEAESMIPEVNLSSIKLFVKSWALLAPVLGPLFVIVTLNFLNPTTLTMDCEFKHSFEVKFMCALTLPGVRLFPRMGIILGLLLLAWRMVHERAYYMLMKHKVMVDLDAGKRFGFWTLLVLSVLFVIACLHFILKFFAGHPCSETDGKCDGDKFMFQNSFSEVIFHPSLLTSPENNLASHFLNMAVMTFIVPGIVSISTLAGLLNLEGELMPLSKMLENEPCKVYRDLGKFIYVPENVIRNIVRFDGLNIFKAGTRCEFEDVCKEVYETAYKQGCSVLGSTAEPEVMSGAMSEAAAVPASLLSRLGELLYIDWWPVKLLIETELNGSLAHSFRHILGIHYLGTSMVILAMSSLSMMRLVEYGKIVFSDFGANWVMLIPEVLLGVEMSFQIIWFAQVHKYAKYAFEPDPESLAKFQEQYLESIPIGGNGGAEEDDATKQSKPPESSTTP